MKFVVYRTRRIAVDALEVQIEPTRVTLKNATGATLVVIPVPSDWWTRACDLREARIEELEGEEGDV